MHMKQFAVCIAIFLTGCASSSPDSEAEPIEEDYWGLPNLVIQAFIPPVIFAGEGDTIYLSDLTANVGDNIAEVTIIRYYISDTSPVDVTSALIIGERQVRELKPGEHDESLESPFVIPAGAGSPPLFLAACVDVGEAVDELAEDDNCTTSPAGAEQLIFDSGAVTPR